MTRDELDRRIRAHQTAALAIQAADEVLRPLRERQARLQWLERRYRAGLPLPGTPEWDAENERVYQDIHRQEIAPGRAGGFMHHGIWYSTFREREDVVGRSRVFPTPRQRCTPESKISLRGREGMTTHA